MAAPPHGDAQQVEGHYQDFLAWVGESLEFVPMRVLAYCLMPNHGHLVLYPRADGDLSKFLPRIDPHAALSREDPNHSSRRLSGSA